MIRKMMNAFWLRVVWFAMRRIRAAMGTCRAHQSGRCANRKWRKAYLGHVEVTITQRDLWKPDGYSREELLNMLWTVREHEAQQGWRVPEPMGNKLSPAALESTRALLKDTKERS